MPADHTNPARIFDLLDAVDPTPPGMDHLALEASVRIRARVAPDACGRDTDELVARLVLAIVNLTRINGLLAARVLRTIDPTE